MMVHFLYHYKPIAVYHGIFFWAKWLVVSRVYVIIPFAFLEVVKWWGFVMGFGRYCGVFEFMELEVFECILT